LLSLSPMKWPRHHLTNCRYLGRWKVLNSSILGMQEAMKMRWGDSKNLQKRDRSSCVSSLEHVALDGLKTRSSGVKCCQTLRNEIETLKRHIPWENDSYSQKRSPINSRQKVKQKLTTVVELPRRSAKWYLWLATTHIPLRKRHNTESPKHCPCKKQNWPEALV